MITKKALVVMCFFFLDSLLVFSQKEGSGPKTQASGPALVLKGLDPVWLVQGKEEKGKESFSTVHKGFKYLFVSAAQKAAFEANSEKYAAQDEGICPIARVDLHQDIKGNPAIFAVHQGKIYLFANNDARESFKKNPSKYAKGSPKEGSAPLF